MPDSPPLRGEGWGGGFEEKKKQSIVVARLFSYWGGSAVVCLGIGRAAHVGMGSTIVYPLSLSLAAAAQTFPVHTAMLLHGCLTVACLKSVTPIVHALCPAVVPAFKAKCLQPDNACIMLYLSLSLSVTCHGPGHTPAMMWGGCFPTPDEPPPTPPNPE